MAETFIFVDIDTDNEVFKLMRSPYYYMWNALRGISRINVKVSEGQETVPKSSLSPETIIINDISGSAEQKWLETHFNEGAVEKYANADSKLRSDMIDVSPFYCPFVPFLLPTVLY